MTNQLVLNLITTITLFCSGPGKIHTSTFANSESLCFKTIWTCGHKLKNAAAIIPETHNCITDYLKEN